MLSGAIEQAQKTVESRNFQTRKSVLEYDDVMNQQRNIIYGERRKVLDGEDIQQQIMNMISEFVSSTVADGLGGVAAESQQQLDAALQPFEKLFMRPGTFKIEDFGGFAKCDKVTEKVQELAEKVYAAREAAFGNGPDGKPLMRELERVVMLRVVDEYWMDHIDAMSELKRGIGLRGYGAVKPIDAYKQEGFDMFEAMVHGIREETVRRLFVVRVRQEQPIERKAVAKNAAANAGGEPVKKQPVKKAPKPGRNDPCPCGKMKADGSRRLKYKECCGRNE
jgi:preprotein translocase subunit SecA